MGMIMDFGVMGRMFMLMRAMLAAVLMVMHMDVTGMRVGVRMFMHVFMLMNVSMFVSMNHLAMAMLMSMYVGMLMIMQVSMFVSPFHYFLLPS